MRVAVGDEIVVDGVRAGEPARKAEILEVLHVGDVTHYRIRWDDGQEAFFYPGPTTHVVHFADRAKRHA